MNGSAAIIPMLTAQHVITTSMDQPSPPTEEAERLQRARKRLSPRLVVVLEEAEVWTKFAYTNKYTDEMRRCNSKEVQPHMHTFRYTCELFVKCEVLHLETLAERNFGLTPTRLEKDFALSIGAATRLKILAGQAHKNWVAFARKHGHNELETTDIAWNKRRSEERKRKHAED
jgi:hypothetical protein